MSLIYLGSAWVAGIFLGSKFALPLALVFVGLMPLPLLLFWREHRKLIILSSFCLLVFFGGALRFQSSLPASDDASLHFYADRGAVEVKGVVDRDPEVRDKTARLRLSAREILVDGEWRAVSGAALLFVPRYSTYSYGDLLLVTGRLETPPRLDDFDYRDYLAHQGIYATMRYPEIEVLETGTGLKPLQWIYWLRKSLSQTLTQILPEPPASLAQGIILGHRGNIPLSVRADFIHTGTAHLLAISGLHLSIVAGILLSLGVWLFGRRGHIYIWLALGAIWMYAVLTGMQPPVFRAAIMASLFLTAELLGRQRSAATALVFAAALMVAVTPQVLWQAAFQLSFAAMAGLIFIFPIIQSLGRRALNAFLGEGGTATVAATFVADSLSVSLGAVIAVWPLVAHYFGVISPVAPLATFFALPALPAIIITGALAGLIGLISLAVAQVVAWLTWFFAWYMLWVVKILAAIPFVEGGSVDTVLIGGYYSALVLVIWLSNNRAKLTKVVPEVVGWLKSGVDKSLELVLRAPKKWLMPPLLAVAVVAWLAVATMPDDNLQVSFLDVGQGDAILLQRGSQQVLVDGGPSPEAIALALGREMPFWDRTIELVVLTHPHADHVAGLVEVLNRYRVKQVLYADLQYESLVYGEWFRLLEEGNIKYTLARAGQQIDLGTGVTIEVLNPQVLPSAGGDSDIDNNGVVLRLSMGEVSFLLTADIMWEAEYELIASRGSLTSTVLKVSHHGSPGATTAAFLAAVNPQVAVISVGEDNPFGHPSSEVVDRLEQKVGQENIYLTGEHATIEFITDGERLWVRTESP